MSKFSDIKENNKRRKEIKYKKKEEKLNKKIAEKKKKELQKKLILENKKVSKKFIDISSLADIDNYDNIVLNYGYMDIFKVNSFDILGMNEYESYGSILDFTMLLKTYHSDIKIIAMNFPSNTTEQKRYIKKKIQIVDTEEKLEVLQELLKQLEEIERVRSDRQYYIFIFGENQEDLEKKKKEIMKNGRKLGVERVDIMKKFKIMYKLNNMNSKIN